MQQTNVNTGIYFVRSSAGGRALMRGWAELRKFMSHENDQVRGCAPSAATRTGRRLEAVHGGGSAAPDAHVLLEQYQAGSGGVHHASMHVLAPFSALGARLGVSHGALCLLMHGNGGCRWACTASSASVTRHG